MNDERRRLFTTLALGLGLTLALLWSLSEGMPGTSLAQAGTGIICVATTGIDALGCGTFASPCRTPQYAVDLAGGGEEIRVATGVYTGVQTRGGSRQLVIITKTLTLQGGYDATFGHAVPLSLPTVLDAEKEGRVVRIEAASPTLEGFWVTGGNGSHALFDEGHGGGIYSSGGAPTIANNVISGNMAYTGTSEVATGGGLYVCNVPGGAQVVISGNVVMSNVASTANDGRGGGLHIEGADGVQVLGNAVLSNTACITGGQGYGGGLYLTHADGAVFQGNRIEHNVGQRMAGACGSYGGGLALLYSDDVVMSGNSIRHNTASVAESCGYGGGVYAVALARLHLEANTLEANRAATVGLGQGGAAYVSSIDGFVVTGNRLLSNTAGRGGGFSVGSRTVFTLTNNIVAGNAGWYAAAGVDVNGSTTWPTTGTLLHNTLAANNRGSDPGPSAIYARCATLVLTNNLIYSHAVGFDGAPSSSARLYNTLFYANDDDISTSGYVTNIDPVSGKDPRLDASYRLRAGSAAIDAGADAGVVTDIDGDPRPHGTHPDIGADEAGDRWLFLPVVYRARLAG